jgi:hypothetical protein
MAGIRNGFLPLFLWSFYSHKRYCLLLHIFCRYGYRNFKGLNFHSLNLQFAILFFRCSIFAGIDEKSCRHIIPYYFYLYDAALKADR